MVRKRGWRPALNSVAGVVAAGAVGVAAAAGCWTRRAMRWGATPEEIETASTAESWFADVPGARVQMTRAVSIAAPTGTVWSWLSQNGRGAGWYSYEALDNGGRPSAKHIVTWIPEPAVGDAAAIGYLRHVEPGVELVWWAPDDPFLGARTWSAWQYTVAPEATGSRLLMRVDLATSGPTAWLPLMAVPVIDSIMATRQLHQIKVGCERYGARRDEPDNPETGARDQYQEFHVIYASGDEAGVPGVENAARAREWALADGFI